MRKAQITWILSVFLVILIADQVTKSIVMATIEVNPPRQSDTFFYFSHQRNEGLVGGMFSSNWLVTRAAPFVATLVLAYLFRHLNAASRLQSLAYGLVVGGAIGNLVDRIRLGSVTDFLQFHFYFIPFDFPWKFYPAFNIADSAICVGVVVLVFSWNAGYQQDEPETT